MSRLKAAARACVSNGGTKIPQCAVTISCAPPIAVVTTGKRTDSASTNVNPNDSADVLGWQ
jgi:hypothetical protein